MRLRRRSVLLRALSAALLISSAASASLLSAAPANRDLTLAERIAAQRAIEKLYYSYQLGASRPFEEVASDDRLERKVVSYLKESIALERFWGTPVTMAVLTRELERIVKGTRLPERLREVYAALDNDPVLILECFVRPVLVERLTRNFFSTDERIHGEARLLAERLRVSVARGEPFDVVRHRVDHVEFRRGNGKTTAPRGSRQDLIQVELAPDEFDRLLRGLLDRPNVATEIIEERHRFAFRLVVERSSDSVRIREYTVPKRSWESWWAEVAPDFDEDLVRAVRPSVQTIPEPTGEPMAREYPAQAGPGMGSELVSCPPSDSWSNGSLDDVRTPRTRHTAIWTGSTMLIWGGANESGLVGQGEAYDPLTDVWTTISSINAPSSRVNHVAVWTGQEMIVWGGLSMNTGGRYDPATDQWRATATLSAPVGRSEATAVWTGSVMIVWGGRADTTLLGSGGRYDPATDSWKPTSLTNAPEARIGHTAIWTGSRMVVWGGRGGVNHLNTGGRYDPISDTWSPTTTVSAPVGRLGHVSVWTSSLIVVWGGGDAGGNDVNTGGRYDPVANSWTPTSTVAAPQGRLDASAVWTGTDVVVWGGAGSFGPTGFNTGGRYNPATDSWRPVTLANSPGARYDQSGVWTGTLMVVWGGSFDFNEAVHATGGRYDPASDRWTPINPPGYRGGHTAIWTGNLMIVWGGGDFVVLDSGGRYDPLSDTWTETSRTNAPSARGGHTAMWTGDAMIVWGGSDGVDLTDTGGRYDPVMDTWMPTSTTGAPSPRQRHAAVWTGTEMIVWGGTDGTALQSGGRYDPVTDTWDPTGVVNVPAARQSHSATWTGAEMVVWGGIDTSGAPLASGGRFDPASDIWSGTSLIDAPGPRAFHTAVWTGSRMIVWGGSGGGPPLMTGGQYDPVSNEWMPTTTSGAPAGRPGHVAVWTGLEMIVWGGRGADTGARYDPVLDRWTSTTTIDAPKELSFPAAVWTGSEMIAWGGVLTGIGQTLDTGGRYLPGTDSSPDLDQDGISTCRGDCDDANPSLWSTPGEARDLAIAADAGTISWAAPWFPGGSTVAYDTLRSSAPSDFTGAAACLETNGTDNISVDGSTPAEGGVFFYLVRAENGCSSGQGPLGNHSDGTPRVGRTCP